MALTATGQVGNFVVSRGYVTVKGSTLDLGALFAADIDSYYSDRSDNG